MPVVVLRFKKEKFGFGPFIRDLSRSLPAIVSKALDVPTNPEARLKPSEVAVHVNEAHPLDVNTCDLEILIYANDYKERTSNIEERKGEILKAINAHIFISDVKEVTGCIWILSQQNTSFGSLS